MILGIDVSRWQQKVDWALLKSKGVEFAFMKATQGNYLVDPMLKKHVDGALAVGMILGVYHWDDPAIPAARQRDFFMEKTQDIPFKLVAIDAEQEWSDWSEFNAKKPITKFYDPAKLSQHTREIYEAFNHGIKAPIGIYMRQSWVLSYAKPMLGWLDDEWLWLAYYLKKDGIPEFGEFPWEKQWPAKARNLKFWQFSGGGWKLPGVSQALDLNIWGGTLEELKAFCGIPSPSVPLPPAGEGSLEEKVNLLITEARAHGWNV